MARPRDPRGGVRIHYAWIVTGVTCLALLAVAGVRSSSGVFVHPLQHEFGWIFLAHQIGAGLASYVGGLVYDLTGTYTLAFLSAGVLGILAAGMVLAIREPGRAAPAPAVRAAPATGD